jgi:hypothetical protein
MRERVDITRHCSEVIRCQRAQLTLRPDELAAFDRLAPQLRSPIESVYGHA